MTILVTGANGQLGNEMRIISKNSPDKYIFTDVNQVEGVETIYLDITDLEAIRKMVADNKVNAIVNCAAWTNVDGAEDSEKYAIVEKLNATAPENLAKAMKEVDGLLIHISTDYVFGGDPYNTPCKEDQKGTPTGIYGLTKLHGEQNIIRVLDEEPSPFKGDKRGSYLIIRTAWLYSEFGKNFCKTMLNLTATKPQLKVVFDQVGTPTYALDLANAIATILEDYKKEILNSQFSNKRVSECRTEVASVMPSESGSPKATVNYSKSGVYHFSNEGVCSWYDFTKMIQQIASELALTAHRSPLNCDIQPCHSNEFPSPVTRPSYSVLDKTKIKETFGISIPYWTDSLRKCIANIMG